MTATYKSTLQTFVRAHSKSGTTVLTGEHSSYTGIPRRHQVVQHSDHEYVNGDTYIRNFESFWVVFKRTYKGTCHWMNAKHLFRYVTEFVGRHNSRLLDALGRLQFIMRGMVGKRLRYVDLIA